MIEAPGAPGSKGAIPTGALPVVLLRGISWRALREPLTLTKGLQTLVEMQYRGDVFRQRRQARDWTVATFLRDRFAPPQARDITMKEKLDKAKVVNQQAALQQAARQYFYNTSKFTLRDLRRRAGLKKKPSSSRIVI